IACQGNFHLLAALALELYWGAMMQPFVEAEGSLHGRIMKYRVRIVELVHSVGSSLGKEQLKNLTAMANGRAAVIENREKKFCHTTLCKNLPSSTLIPFSTAWKALQAVLCGSGHA
ncbi:hypothetical protein Ciccas_010450, partial [Cichlidogyrus casuarinus]